MPLENGALVQGTINVGMSVIDSSSSSGVESEKKLAISSALNIPDGYVLLATGTVGSTEVEFNATALGMGYTNSNGATPSTRDLAYDPARSFIAFTAQPEAVLTWARKITDPQDFCRLVSVNGSASVSSGYGGPSPGGFSQTPSFTVSLIPGTTVTSATYTVMAFRGI